MPNDSFQKLLPDDAQELPHDKPVPHFKKIYMIGIDIKRRGQSLSIVLDDDKPGNSDKIRIRSFTLPENATDAQLEQGVAELLAGRGDETDLDKKRRAGHKFEATTMSMNFKDDCYILFKMNKHMDNVRFSKDYFAFMREDLERRANPIRWGNRVKYDGTSAELVPDEKDTGAGYSAALFAYERTLYPAQDDAENNFRCRFNLYLDVVDAEIGSQEEADAPYIPIIVDPDVRFPGGNEGP